MFDEYDMFLIGIGEEFEEKENASQAYEGLKKIIDGKNYFFV